MKYRSNVAACCCGKSLEHTKPKLNRKMDSQTNPFFDALRFGGVYMRLIFHSCRRQHSSDRNLPPAFFASVFQIFSLVLSAFYMYGFTFDGSLLHSVYYILCIFLWNIHKGITVIHINGTY